MVHIGSCDVKTPVFTPWCVHLKLLKVGVGKIGSVFFENNKALVAEGEFEGFQRIDHVLYIHVYICIY